MTAPHARFWHRYLPISAEMKRWPVYVIGCGFASVPAGHPYPPTQHPSDHHFTWRRGRVLDEYQLVYLTRGGGWFESRETGRRRVSAGHLWALFPGVWHRYTPARATGWDEYWLAFAGTQAASVIARYGFTPARPIRMPGVCERLVQVYEKILDELREEQYGSRTLIAAWIHEALARADVEERRRELAGREIGEAVLKARARMAECTDRNLDMRQLARELHVGYSWLRRKFRAYTGFSPGQYHLQLRINRAQELLRATSLPISEIAARIGMSGVHYFSRVFRAKTGVSPSEYRARAQGNEIA